MAESIPLVSISTACDIFSKSAKLYINEKHVTHTYCFNYNLYHIHNGWHIFCGSWSYFEFLWVLKKIKHHWSTIKISESKVRSRWVAQTKLYYHLVWCQLNVNQWCGNSQSCRTLSDKSSERPVNWN